MTAEKIALTTTPKKQPSHIILLEPYGLIHPAGRVLPVSDDLLGLLDKASVKYREATEQERCIGCPG